MRQELQKAIHLYQRGNREQAEQICQKILSVHRGQPDTLLLMGLIAKDRGSPEQACKWFQKGLKRAPRNAHLLNNLGSVERQLKEYAKAESHFKQALKFDPNHFQARHNLAGVYKTQREYSKAKRLYQEVIDQQPKFADALAGLSSILEKEHQLPEARLLSNRALKINANHFIASLTLANIAIREEEYEEAIKLLLPLMQSQKLSVVNFAVAGGKCAYAHEKMKNYKTAFTFYRNSNQALQQAFQARMQNTNSPYAPAAVRRVDKAIDNFDFSCRAEEKASPVFLIGFPRSGTTLLDQILSSHSDIRVVEEKENLIDAFARFPTTEKGLSELNKATDAELKKLRSKYWTKLNQEVDTKKPGPIVVDKYPLNAISLLHIYKLFPNAKIIVALRDPRDCVFSCYQQRFGINPAMFQMLDLDTAVAYYDQVMRLISKVRDTKVLQMHFIRYENVVGNFEDEVRALTDFLDLEWEDALFDYRTTAKSRHISTPSASQVIQPLYTSSIGKWEHYQEWIGASFDPLGSWVEEWGYQEDPG